MEVKYNRKSYVAYIKRLAPSKAAPIHSEIDASVKVTRNNKVSTGVIPIHKQHG